MKAGIVSALLLVAAAAPAQAEDRRTEASLHLGYTGSSGIDSDEVAPSGQAATFVEVRPKSGFTWGVDAGYFVTDKIQVAALVTSQKSELQYTVGTTFKQVGEGLDVQNFMGTVAYHTGDLDSLLRFYVLGGVGATRYGEVSFVGTSGQAAQTRGTSKFATTWGIGVKGYEHDRFGWKLGVRWTPTNLGETSDEWECAPFLPVTCTVTGTNTQYAHQYEIAAAFIVRF
jgi:hypothetical protein